MIFSCVTLGWPGASGFPVMSNFSDSNQAGPPVICWRCRSKAIVMRSLNVVLIVITSLPLTVNNFPGLAGSLGLMVATSNPPFASAAIGFGGGGGSGIAQAV